MKIQLKPWLLLVTISFTIFASCKKDDGFVSPSKEASSKKVSARESNSATAKPADVFLNTTTLTSTGTPPSVVKTGSYVASPELGTSGTYVMDVHFFGQAFHCTTTFTPIGGGEFTTQSECEMTNLTGQWRVVGGTGIYADLSGNGSIVMVPGHENAVGRVFSN